MNNNLKDTLWSTIWIVCISIFLWMLMFIMATRGDSFDCQATVGCENAIVEQFPEGHGR
jgi:hypothetical protein